MRIHSKDLFLIAKNTSSLSCLFLTFSICLFQNQRIKIGNLYSQYRKIMISRNNKYVYMNAYISMYFWVCVFLKRLHLQHYLETSSPTYPSSSFIIFVSHLTAGHNSTKFLPPSKNSLSSSCWKHVPRFFWALVSRHFNIHISTNGLLKASYTFCIML